MAAPMTMGANGVPVPEHSTTRIHDGLTVAAHAGKVWLSFTHRGEGDEWYSQGVSFSADLAADIASAFTEQIAVALRQAEAAKQSKAGAA